MIPTKHMDDGSVQVHAFRFQNEILELIHCIKRDLGACGSTSLAITRLDEARFWLSNIEKELEENG